MTAFTENRNFLEKLLCLSWNLDCSSIIMRCLYSFFSVKFCILVIFQIMQIKFYFHTLLLQIYFSKIMPHFPTKWPYTTGTCLIKKIYAPSSSLLQGKHLPFSPSPLFASIFFAYLWSFYWPNYIVALLRYFSFRLPHLNIPTGPPSDELDKNSQRTWLSENFSHWNGYSHFRSGLNWFRK